MAHHTLTMTNEADREGATSASEESEPDVADLVWRLRAGERSALAEAYDIHASALRSFAQRLLGEEGAADDLVHEVFLALPRAVRRYQGRGTLRSFLIAVAINRCRHHVRAAARYRRAKARYAEERGPARPSSPAELHDRREMAERLALALDQLPLDSRVAFVMAVVEGRSSTEIAPILGVAEVTVRTRVARARARLRAILEEEPRDG